ncbi:MAG: mannose-1-phosphate guanylyltransferase [bacterium]
MKKKVYAVILAGGHGTRFWPRSRKKRPKQLLDIIGSESMIQLTISRIKPLIPIENILIVTNKEQAPLIKDHLPQIKPENILAEPCGRNTAPALALASAYLLSKHKDSIMIVLTADHLIQKHYAFLSLLNEGTKMACKDEYLITLGIKPEFPETGYGYIQAGDKLEGLIIGYKAKRYVEKPDKKTAEEYLRDGRYLWNSGMFIWKTQTFWQALERFLPDIYLSFCRLKDAFGTPNYMETAENIYKDMESISVDYGIMEKSDKVIVIPANIGWNDVGSWTALDKIMKKGEDGNIIIGQHLGIDSKNIIAYSHKKLITTLGIQDLIIVDTEDALLVCHKDRAQEIKNIVSLLEKRGMDEYL